MIMVNRIPNLDLQFEPSPFQNREAYQQKNHNWSVLNQYGSSLSDYMDTSITGFQNQINNLIKGVKQPDEVVNARDDSWKKTWPTLKARIDNNEQNTPRIMDTGQDSDALSLIEVRDLSTTSSNFSYEQIKSLADITLPAMGYASIGVKSLSFDIVD